MLNTNPKWSPWPLALCALVLTSLPIAAQSEEIKPTARPFLWRIETAVPSYVYGTMHIGDPRITTLPKTVEDALSASDSIFGELDLSPRLMGQMLRSLMLPRGQTLEEVIGQELHAELMAEIELMGLPKFMFRRWRPWAAAMTLPLAEEIKAAQAGKDLVALDQQILDAGRKANKKVRGLETLDEQIGVFEGLSADEQRSYLEGTIRQVRLLREKGERPLQNLIEVYLSGDEERMMASAAGYQEGIPEDLAKKLMQRLLTHRNQMMTHRIVQTLQEESGDQHFFAVGAAHLFGDDGLLKLLSARGYRLTRLEGEDARLAERKEALKALQAKLAEELSRVTRALEND